MIIILRYLSRSAFFLCFGEDDLVHKEENHHADATVEHCGSDIVDPIGYELSGSSDPDAVDGVHDARNDDKGQQIPQGLIPDVALATKHQTSLDWKVNGFSNHHSYHVSHKVAKPAMSLVIAQDVPLEGFTEQRHIDTWPAKISVRQVGQHFGQEL